MHYYVRCILQHQYECLLTHAMLQIYPVMAACTAFIYLKFDRTKTGLILGALLAIGAPAGEAVIANGLHWWHYDRPDTPFLDICYWTGEPP